MAVEVTDKIKMYDAPEKGTLDESYGLPLQNPLAPNSWYWQQIATILNALRAEFTQIKGVAVSGTNPVSPKVGDIWFYSTEGSYPYFGTPVTKGEVGYFVKGASSWTKKLIVDITSYGFSKIKGAALSQTNPGSSEEGDIYFYSSEGTYPYFGTPVTRQNEIGFFKKGASSWDKVPFAALFTYGIQDGETGISLETLLDDISTYSSTTSKFKVRGESLKDASVQLSSFSQAVLDYIGSGGTVTNQPDERHLDKFTEGTEKLRIKDGFEGKTYLYNPSQYATAADLKTAVEALVAGGNKHLVISDVVDGGGLTWYFSSPINTRITIAKGASIDNVTIVGGNTLIDLFTHDAIGANVSLNGTFANTEWNIISVNTFNVLCDSSKGGRFNLTNDFTLTKSQDLPPDTTLVPRGGVITFDTFDITGSSSKKSTIDDYMYQIFDENSTGRITDIFAWKNSYVRPEWWGGAGDGVVDNSDPTQRAINFSHTFRYVLFSYGLYKFSSPINVGQDTTIRGTKSGEYTTRLYSDVDGNIINSLETNWDPINSSSSGDINRFTVSNILFVGTKNGITNKSSSVYPTDYNTEPLIHFDQAFRVRFEDVTFQNGIKGILMERTSAFWFKNVNFYDFETYAIYGANGNLHWENGLCERGANNQIGSFVYFVIESDVDGVTSSNVVIDKVHFEESKITINRPNVTVKDSYIYFTDVVLGNMASNFKYINNMDDLHSMGILPTIASEFTQTMGNNISAFERVNFKHEFHHDNKYLNPDDNEYLLLSSSFLSDVTIPGTGEEIGSILFKDGGVTKFTETNTYFKTIYQDDISTATKRAGIPILTMALLKNTLGLSITSSNSNVDANHLTSVRNWIRNGTFPSGSTAGWETNATLGYSAGYVTFSGAIGSYFRLTTLKNFDDSEYKIYYMLAKVKTGASGDMGYSPHSSLDRRQQRYKHTAFFNDGDDLWVTMLRLDNYENYDSKIGFGDHDEAVSMEIQWVAIVPTSKIIYPALNTGVDDDLTINTLNCREYRCFKKTIGAATTFTLDVDGYPIGEFFKFNIWAEPNAGVGVAPSYDLSSGTLTIKGAGGAPVSNYDNTKFTNIEVGLTITASGADAVIYETSG